MDENIINKKCVKESEFLQVGIHKVFFNMLCSQEGWDMAWAT